MKIGFSKKAFFSIFLTKLFIEETMGWLIMSKIKTIRCFRFSFIVILIPGTVDINKHCCKYVRIYQENITPLQPPYKYDKVNLNKTLGLKSKVFLIVWSRRSGSAVTASGWSLFTTCSGGRRRIPSRTLQCNEMINVIHTTCQPF